MPQVKRSFRRVWVKEHKRDGIKVEGYWKHVAIEMKKSERYTTLEEDLMYCFEKRGIVVDSLKVDNGATTYLITVHHVPRSGKI
jgi:hypothetical protein